MLKTLVGLANAACAALDSMEFSFVVGSIAGDDTVFVVMRDTESAVEFCKELKDML